MTEPKTVMVTGAAGFIGQHLIERILATTDWHVHAIDRANIPPMGDRVERTHGDLTEPVPADAQSVDVVFSLAADVDVAWSLRAPATFIANNVAIATTIVNYARAQDTPPLIVHVTTAEVFGPGGPHGWQEPAKPTNPYAASKAAQDAIFHAAATCYGIPVTTARTANVFGEHQTSDKFIPTVIRQLKAGEQVTLFGDAWRRWIHANDVADNLIALAQFDAIVAANITGTHLVRNADIVHKIAWHLEVDPLIDYGGNQRPGHEDIYDLPPHDNLVDDDLWGRLEQTVKAHR